MRLARRVLQRGALLLPRGGMMVILAGYLEARTNVAQAWTVVFFALGLILVALSLYHARVLPKGEAERHSKSLREMYRTFADVVVSFFKKPNIILLLVFILLYRAGEEVRPRLSQKSLFYTSNKPPARSPSRRRRTELTERRLR